MDYRGFLAGRDLQALIDLLCEGGHRVLGPVVRDGAIQYADLADADDLPSGYQQRQSPGNYRLTRTDSPRRFAWANGPQALKPWLFAPHEPLWTVRRNTNGSLHFETAASDARPLAVIGLRACDLAALRLLDQHFLADPQDPRYAARRHGLLRIAVHCTHPAATCFCASTGDGPRAGDGFDLALSEIDEGYLVEANGPAGHAIAAQLPLREVRETEKHGAERQITAAGQRQIRSLPDTDLSRRLFDRLHHPRWTSVAGRCLGCGNCTSVCPTCFCHRHVEAPALAAEHSTHSREWDSCFTEGHSYLHGFVVRPETEHRYRQWLTHKLGSWHQQYGRSGCVGCGRCISWCPVGIDITEEAAAICADESEGRPT